MVEKSRDIKNGRGNGDRLDIPICLNPDNWKRLVTLEGWSKIQRFPLTPYLTVCVSLHRQVWKTHLNYLKCETSQGTVVCNICRFLWLNLTTEHVRQAVRHDEPNTSYLERCNNSSDICSGTESWTCSWLKAGLCKTQSSSDLLFCCHSLKRHLLYSVFLICPL